MIPPKYDTHLRLYADAVVARVCRLRLGRMSRPPTIEIDFVAPLVENGAPLQEQCWRRVLGADLNVRVAGVFTHKSPLVSVRGTPPRPVMTIGCELADLLVLHSHQTASGKVFRRGALMQTKLDRGGAFIPDDPQFWLYDDWPPFAVRSPGFDSRDRHFGGDRRSGCYGLVSTAGWWVMPPVSPMTAAAPECVSLAGFLVDMLYDMDPAQPYRRSETGRQVYHNSTKDWSVTIMELIQITGLRAFRHMGKKVGLYPGPMSRIGGGVFFMTLKDRYSNGNAFDEDGEGPVEEGRGFGVLVIETDAFDERKG